MYAETKHEWGMDNTLSAEVMRPLEERIAEEKPALSGCLAKLRELLPKEVFDRSFAKVENSFAVSVRMSIWSSSTWAPSSNFSCQEASPRCLRRIRRCSWSLANLYSPVSFGILRPAIIRRQRSRNESSSKSFCISR